MTDNPIYARLMRTPTWYIRPDARHITVWIAVTSLRHGNWAWLWVCAGPFILPFTGQFLSAYFASRLEEAIERRSQVGS